MTFKAEKRELYLIIILFYVIKNYLCSQIRYIYEIQTAFYCLLVHFDV